MATIQVAMVCMTTAALLSFPGGRCAEIIGGRVARAHSWPYIALVKADGNQCGGTLIRSQWVLTAAHCKSKNMEVVLGAHNLSKNEKEKQNFRVIQAVAHKKFSSKTGENDLLLLKLNEPAKINKNVRTLPLPKRVKDFKNNTSCKVAGWGLTKVHPKKRSDTLMEVKIHVFNRKACEKYYKNLTNNMLCAWDERGKKDTCLGDSGGPLLCDGKFAAVVSFGRLACGDAPGVYTLLTDEYVTWIDKVTGGDQELFEEF